MARHSRTSVAQRPEPSQPRSVRACSLPTRIVACRARVSLCQDKRGKHRRIEGAEDARNADSPRLRDEAQVVRQRPNGRKQGDVDLSSLKAINRVDLYIVCPSHQIRIANGQLVDSEGEQATLGSIGRDDANFCARKLREAT